MNLKRHWNETEGLEKIYEKKNSACNLLEVYGLKLAPGAVFEGETGEMEYGVTILSGAASFRGEGFSFEKIGGRKTVFEDRATAVYLPRRARFTVKAEGEFRAVIAACPADKDFKPYVIRPEDVVVKTFGKPGFQREVHFVMDERFEGSRIYIGENRINGNEWTGFPGHKHDVNAPDGKEIFAEEIYYYEFDKPTGYGIQQVYSGDRKIDEAFTTRNGDLVEIPKAYHPGTVAPGYVGYLLWMMSCDKRALISSQDPDQAWQAK